MQDEADLLASAGVPLGPPRPPPRSLPDDAVLRRATFVVARRLTAEEALPYAAWLVAFAHHWPSRFARVFGDEGRELHERWRAAVADTGRFIKLRRIAIENLSHVL